VPQIPSILDRDGSAERDAARVAADRKPLVAANDKDNARWEAELARLDELANGATDGAPFFAALLAAALGATGAFAARLGRKRVGAGWELLASQVERTAQGLQANESLPLAATFTAWERLSFAAPHNTETAAANRFTPWSCEQVVASTETGNARVGRIGWQIEDGQQGLLELEFAAAATHESELPATADSWPAGFALALAEIAAEDQRRRRLRGTAREQQRWQTLWEFQQRLQTGGTLAAVAQLTVEELRRILGCDRAAVVLADGSPRAGRKPRWRLLAISGTAQADPHSETARLLADLARAASAGEQVTRWGDLSREFAAANHANREDQNATSENDTEQLSYSPPEARSLWEAYADATAVRGAILLPWRAGEVVPPSQAAATENASTSSAGEQRPQHHAAVHADLKSLLVRFPADVAANLDQASAAEEFSTAALAPRGVLVWEWFHSHPRDEERNAALWPLLAQVTAQALERARRIDELPGIGLARRLGRWRDGWLTAGLTRGRLAFLAAGAAFAALALIKVDFQVTARGTIWPAERRELFAPDDAVVRQVLVDHGSPVRAGQPLAVLESPALDQQRTQLRGEISTAGQRLATLAAERLQLETNTTAALTRAEQLTAEEAELKFALAAAQTQLAIVEERRAALKLVAPFAGTVLTWNARTALTGRPVARGEMLLTVAALAGPWEAELLIPDDVSGYAAAARDAQLEPLPITVRPATAPQTSWLAALDQFSQRNETDPVWGTGVRATVPLQIGDAGGSAARANLTPGGEVTARIPCGRRALGFVLFRDLYDAWLRWW